jgi:hypothetical protein
MRRCDYTRTDLNDIFVMFLRAGIRCRHDQSGLRNARRTEREVKKMPLFILFLAHHLDGPVRDRAGRNAGPRQSQGVTGDSTMTDRDNGLNRRNVLDIRNGRLVEAHMALICGEVITWFIGCRL